MTKMNQVMLMVSGLVLAGCAATPKPEMTDNEYWETARTYIQLHTCNTQGWISPETAATGLRYYGYKLNRYTWNVARLDNQVADLQKGGYVVSQPECKQLALGIHTLDQRVKATQQASDSTPSDFGTASRSTNTYCNRIGQQTFCRTY